MKYEVGDTISIKPIEWFNTLCNGKSHIMRGVYILTRDRANELCGRFFKVKVVSDPNLAYYIEHKGELAEIKSWMIDEFTSDKIKDAKVTGLDDDEAINTAKKEITELFDKVETESKSSVDISKLESVPEMAPKKRRGRIPGSKNKPKESKTTVTDVHQSRSKLQVGDRLICWNKNETSLSVGTYLGNENGMYWVLIKGVQYEFSNIRPYSPERLIAMTESILKDSDSINKELNKLIDDFNISLNNLESRYMIKFDRNIKISIL